MASESMDKGYEEVLALAESGQYTEALEGIKFYLSNDADNWLVWNDAGAILYCAGMLDKSIAFFEKARGMVSGTEAAETYHNLCEAYLDAGCPAQAADLFDTMESLEILHCDTINRTANVFIEIGFLGNAIEMLMRSLKMIPEQEILHPMIEVLRSKRIRIAFICDEVTGELQSVFDHISQYFTTELHVSKSSEEIGKLMEWSDVSWFEGFTESAAKAASLEKVCEVIIRASAKDVYDGSGNQINWGNVNVLVLAGGQSTKDAMLEKVHGIENQTEILSLCHGVDITEIKKESLTFKNRTKRIVCLDDIDARSNPGFILQCLQKLNYLDSDYRLHFAGEFTDKRTEQYVRHAVERLNLSSVVFFDGSQNNLVGYLRDKSYVVSTSIDGSGIDGVLSGMAHGLRPVVHAFPGAKDILEAEFVFDISEHFCDQVRNGVYEPARYHGYVAGNYSRTIEVGLVNQILCAFERQRQIEEQQQGNSDSTGVGAPSAVEQVVPKAIPITPIGANLASPELSGPMTTEQNRVGQAEVKAESRVSINEMAAQVLKAAQEITGSVQPESSNNRSPNLQASDATSSGLVEVGSTSLEDVVRDQKIAEMASEFSGIDARNNVSRTKASCVPFAS